MNSRITITDENFIHIPRDILSEWGVTKGDVLQISVENNSLIISKANHDFLKMSESVASKIWDNDIDEAWNDA